VQIGAAGVTLEGDLCLPAGAAGLVLFAHGSGSGRHSPRNHYVAQMINQGGLGTLLIDLLTIEEERADRELAQLRFDVDLLAGRLIAVSDWLSAQPQTSKLALGYFGASTGAGAALIAAAARTERVGAVVSRGGRPDLAGRHLGGVRAPTLLIVGGLDLSVLRLNRQAMLQLPGDKELVVVSGASHLFEEPGALAEVARLALAWFQRHLGGTPDQVAGV
jgi:dienelactone hydrolase